MKTRIFAILAVVVLAILSRLFPHPWNWTAVSAAALFAGAKFERLSLAVAVPLLALALSDLVLGFHGTMIFVYGAFALISIAAWWGRSLLEGRNVAVASLLSSLFFFFVTNAGVWMTTNFYPAGAEGLMMSYAAGLPFLGNQIVGDLFYSAVLFGAWALAETKIPALAPAPRV